MFPLVYALKNGVACKKLSVSFSEEEEFGHGYISAMLLADNVHDGKGTFSGSLPLKCSAAMHEEPCKVSIANCSQCVTQKCLPDLHDSE